MLWYVQSIDKPDPVPGEPDPEEAGPGRQHSTGLYTAKVKKKPTRDAMPPCHTGAGEVKGVLSPTQFQKEGGLVPQPP